MKIKIVKPKIWNFKVQGGKNAWKEVVYSARVSGVSQKIKEKEVFEMIVKNDYTSAIEHIIVKFDLKMTKGNSPEFLEHRMASHTGYSTRYIKVSEGFGKKQSFYEIILPWHFLKPKDKKTKEQKRIFLTNIKQNLQNYENFLMAGVLRESARYILPFCQAVGIYHVTINLRSLLNLLSLRLCTRASPEFRSLASQIYFNLIKKLPIMRGLVGCRGVMRGLCPENEARTFTDCPFKNKNSEIFIPTIKEFQAGIFPKKFNFEKIIQAQEKVFLKFAKWEG
ncbi:FAD-dependent thymidylate synthase [Candidatus Parcubacteria bacterium]|nr:FAD-dependent thymidylate synthase [Candidatus Parcubacteria bacterium]